MVRTRAMIIVFVLITTALFGLIMIDAGNDVVSGAETSARTRQIDVWHVGEGAGAVRTQIKSQ